MCCPDSGPGGHATRCPLGACCTYTCTERQVCTLHILTLALALPSPVRLRARPERAASSKASEAAPSVCRHVHIYMYIIHVPTEYSRWLFSACVGEVYGVGRWHIRVYILRTSHIPVQSAECSIHTHTLCLPVGTCTDTLRTYLRRTYHGRHTMIACVGKEDNCERLTIVAGGFTALTGTR